MAIPKRSREVPAFLVTPRARVQPGRPVVDSEPAGRPETPYRLEQALEVFEKHLDDVLQNLISVEANLDRLGGATPPAAGGGTGAAPAPPPCVAARLEANVAQLANLATRLSDEAARLGRL